MPSLIMKSGSHILQSILENGVAADSSNEGHFCFSCEQIFSDRKFLEEHVCPSTSFICSCGTEFTDYQDMKVHSTTHEPGHQVLHHGIIKKRRIEKCIEEEIKRIRLQEGEVVWSAPIAKSRPSVSGPNSSSLMSKHPTERVQIPQVPELCPSRSDTPSLSNPRPAVKGIQNIFSVASAPTVELWTLYQPVVLVQTTRKFQTPYVCGNCWQGFSSKASLVSHHNSHVTDKVCGCVGCGLLLTSKKFVPRFHTCNSPTSHVKFRLITAKPPNYKTPPRVRKNLFAQQPRVAPALQPKSLNFGTASKGVQPPQILSTQKNLNYRTYNSNNIRGLQVASILHSKGKIPSTSKISAGVSLASKSQNLSVFNQNGQKHLVSPSALRKKTTSFSSMSSEGEFRCRVCHLPFRTPQILQRHKCAKAHEFMAKHVIGKRFQKLPTPNSAQMNGSRMLGFSPSDSAMKSQLVAASIDKGKADVTVTVGDDDDEDDDCYIIEDGANKPAEMIYQVTSSVPIKS